MAVVTELTITGIAAAGLWFLVRLVVGRNGERLERIETKLDDLEERMHEAVDEQDVRQLLNDRLEVITVLLGEVKEDIREIKRKK